MSNENTSKDDEKEVVPASIIPNIIEIGNFLGIPYRNWIEAVAFTLILIAIFLLIPFAPVAKFFFCVVWGGATFMFTLRGINNRSVIQFLSDERKFQKSKRILHLRGPEYVKTKADIKSYEGGDDLIGKYITRLRENVLEWAESKIDEEDSENS